MTLGERLRKYLPDGVEQKVIAMNWIERVEKAGMKPLSASTAPSRLSELLADEPQGVRAFFRDPRRANALFDELGVPEAERAELRGLAEPTLAGAPQPRLVVDVSDLGNDRATMDAVFVGVRDALFGDEGLFPVALVLTDAQYDLLPRSFDRFKDRMHVERVADASAGADAVVRLAGESTCVVSRRPLVELVRWWACDVEKGSLRLEPPDGLARVRAAGCVGVPLVSHPLDASAHPTPAKSVAASTVPAEGVARRRLVSELADEDSAVSKKEPAWRAAAAEELGVRATSTARERIEAEVATVIATLGMEVRSGKAADWDALVARAARRPTEPVAMRIGDTIRALNPPAAVTAARRLEVVRVTCAEPHLVTLENAVAGLTEDDLLDDPLLGGLIHRLAAKDGQALKLLLHARAVLIYGGRVRPKAAKPARDPLGVLRHILDLDVPKAQLRVRVDAPSRKFGSKPCSVDIKPFVYPDGRMYYDAAKASRLLHGAPPIGDILLSRGSTLQAVIPTTGREGDEGHYGDPYSWGDAGEPSALVDPGADAGAWLDDVEASPFFSGTAGEGRWSPDRHLPEPNAPHQWVTIGEPADLWTNADTNLALSWLALRDALPSPRWIRLPDGAVLLQVGGGLAARVAARRYGASDSPARGAVRCTVALVETGRFNALAWRLGDLAAPVTTHVADTGGYHTRISVLMPSIWIAGRGYAVDVNFLPAPMLPGGSPSEATLATAAVAAVAAADTAAREDDLQAMWDDDD